MKTSHEIRQDFLDFFRSKDHTIVPSAPVIPHGDPTLLFTNAGMNQFKDVFLGQGTRQYTRAADTQKCIRVSGKHNDLDEVGRDGYHHTFFEMLGNWSFGDYYKKEAIVWAWELLTEVWQLPKDRLFATVYRDDDEALELWASETDIGRDRIQKFDAKDNFWEMGATGPCGPCSEIHFDRTPDKSGAKLVNAGVPEVMEIWNLVFIQHNRLEDGSLEDLPATHVDTGMGFERIVAVLQNRSSNYDTDIFSPVIAAIESVTGCRCEGDAVVPLQVIADHIRMTSFAIADGGLPANVGQGYVVRRVLRRAARFGRKLGMHEPFLCRLVAPLVAHMGDAFPELRAQAAHVERVIEAEEVSFNKTLDRGIQLFDSAVEDLGGATQLAGDTVFKLYDTYGFPVDMTEQMAAERGLTIDVDGYRNAMAEAKKRSQASTKFRLAAAADDESWTKVIDAAEIEFVGYETTVCDAHVVRYRLAADGQNRIEFVLDRTPFYGESGGQVGDTGTVSCNDFTITVEDTQKADGQIIHLGRLTGTVSDALVTATVDAARRDAIRRNHSATHLLHRALREHLGEHVQQKGSLVSPERLRFDFSHYEGVADSVLQQVERDVNEQIRRNLEVSISHRDLEAAKATGAMALFGEKYDDIVRVVEMGDYSVELCGGTHCAATGDIGYLSISGEGSISSGVRRIEAVTGEAAVLQSLQTRTLVAGAAQLLKCSEVELLERVSGLQSRVKTLQKENAELQQRALQSGLGELLAQSQDIAGVKLVAAQVAGAMDDLKSLGEMLRERLGSGIAVLGSAVDGKAAFVAIVTKDLTGRIKAGDIIRQVAALAGGGGGGAPHVAQAGGKEPDRVPDAIAAVAGIVRDQLSE